MPPEIEGYRTVCHIGVGARSTISRVIRISTGQSFALKRIIRHDSDDDRFLQQAETEYQVTHNLDHPCLRRSLEIRRVRRWFKVVELTLLMEYVAGQTMEQSRPQDLAGTIDLFRKVARGLDAFHAAGYVHADIKPKNIMITDDGGVKIIDFGQSCPIGHKKGRIQGTPDFIAPEQVQRLPLDRRTDVFNLGATLYWALTERSFPTDIAPQVGRGLQSARTEVRGAPQAPKDIVRTIPEALSKLVMECCTKRPDHRPADMKQVIARLDAAEEVSRRTQANRPQGADGENSPT